MNLPFWAGVLTFAVKFSPQMSLIYAEIVRWNKWNMANNVQRNAFISMKLPFFEVDFTFYTIFFSLRPFLAPKKMHNKSKANNSMGKIVKYHTCNDLYPIFILQRSKKKQRIMEEKVFNSIFFSVNWKGCNWVLCLKMSIMFKWILKWGKSFQALEGNK